MEAPEKIYFDGESKACKLPIFSSCNIEYTRTDAFIEKACVKLKKLMYDNLMFQGRLHRGEIIENFVGNFKNYMKGE